MRVCKFGTRMLEVLEYLDSVLTVYSFLIEMQAFQISFKYCRKALKLK